MLVQRTRTLSTPCPHCAGCLEVMEQGIEIGEPAEHVAWAPILQRCVNGCQLTIEDVPPNWAL